MEITGKQIRDDLKNIRYYYSRKKVFENSLYTVGENSIKHIAERYNDLIKDAPPRLFDLYISMYMENNTLFSLAEAWGYSFEHMSRLHTYLVKFIKDKIDKEEKDK